MQNVKAFNAQLAQDKAAGCRLDEDFAELGASASLSATRPGTVNPGRQTRRNPSTTTTGLRWRLHPAFAAGGAASLVGTASPFVA